VIEKENGLCGFIEVSIHPDAENCATTPVGFIEGWWVDPDYRKQGYGGKLLEKAEKWALSKGCRKIASNMEDYREISLKMRQASSYEVTSRGEIIKFKKNIG
jgi:aminoglycoside 6'-N-acetyltransferase I